MWFSQIVYFISDYQRMFDECGLELWPEMSTRGRQCPHQFPLLFCIFYLWRGIACPLDELSLRQYTICENHTTVHRLLIHTLLYYEICSLLSVTMSFDVFWLEIMKFKHPPVQKLLFNFCPLSPSIFSPFLCHKFNSGRHFFAALSPLSPWTKFQLGPSVALRRFQRH